MKFEDVDEYQRLVSPKERKAWPPGERGKWLKIISQEKKAARSFSRVLRRNSRNGNMWFLTGKAKRRVLYWFHEFCRYNTRRILIEARNTETPDFLR